MTHIPDEPDDPGESSGERGDGAGRKLDEDAAWRDIVAHWDDATAPDPVIDRGPEADSGSGVEPDSVVEPGSVVEPVETTDSGQVVDPFDGAPAETGDPPPASRDERLRGLFQPSWNDPLDTEASWNDEGHFVPPNPPPMPVLDPRRRLAWAGLFGSPLLMLVVVVLGWRLPDWLMFLLAASFAGGFIYLVATMPKRGNGDGSGDDGAVV